MKVNRTAVHTHDLLPVILPPIVEAEQADTNLEPQFIKQRSGNTARLYLDSMKPFFEFNQNDIRLSTVNSVNGRVDNLLVNMNRLAVSQFNMFWQPANVNPTNNFYLWNLNDTIGMTGYTFSHTIPTGNYTLQQLMDFIVAEMTNDADGVGLTGGFSMVYNPDGFTSTLNDNIPNTTFIFDFNTSSLVYNGLSLLAMPFMTAPATSLFIGPSRMLYSRYVDIISEDLCSFVKNPNRSINKVNQNVVLRQYLDAPNSSWTYSTVIQNLNWMNWNYLSPLGVIHFRLYDEYGNLFFFLPNPSASQIPTATLNWTMEVILEA